LNSNKNTSVPFRLAFNTLLNKKLINHYWYATNFKRKSRVIYKKLRKK
jgi:hypothetical protein